MADRGRLDRGPRRLEGLLFEVVAENRSDDKEEAHVEEEARTEAEKSHHWMKFSSPLPSGLSVMRCPRRKIGCGLSPEAANTISETI
jgi:hypothetical protein